MHPSWSDGGPVLESVGADHPVRFFLIAGSDGEVQGAMYLDLVDHFLGYIPKVLETSAKWGQVCVTALRNSGWDGRRAFEYWSDPGNETVETYAVGPVAMARNLSELQQVLSRVK